MDTTLRHIFVVVVQKHQSNAVFANYIYMCVCVYNYSYTHTHTHEQKQDGNYFCVNSIIVFTSSKDDDCNSRVNLSHETALFSLCRVYCRHIQPHNKIMTVYLFLRVFKPSFLHKYHYDLSQHTFQAELLYLALYC